MKLRDLKPGDRVLIEVEVIRNDPVRKANPVQVGPTRRREWLLTDTISEGEVWIDAQTAREARPLEG